MISPKNKGQACKHAYRAVHFVIASDPRMGGQERPPQMHICRPDPNAQFFQSPLNPFVQWPGGDLWVSGLTGKIRNLAGHASKFPRRKRGANENRGKTLGAHGIGYPLIVSKWLIILIFSCRVTVI